MFKPKFNLDMMIFFNQNGVVKFFANCGKFVMGINGVIMLYIPWWAL